MKRLVGSQQRCRLWLNKQTTQTFNSTLDVFAHSRNSDNFIHLFIETYTKLHYRTTGGLSVVPDVNGSTCIESCSCYCAPTPLPLPLPLPHPTTTTTTPPHPTNTHAHARTQQTAQRQRQTAYRTHAHVQQHTQQMAHRQTESIHHTHTHTQCIHP